MGDVSMNLCEFLYNKRWIFSICIFAVTIVIWGYLSLTRNNKRKRILTPGRVFFVGVFLAAFAYFMPVYLEKGITGWTAFWASIQHSFRIFGLEGDFREFIFEQEYPGSVNSQFYVSYGAFLYAIAPMLTFGFILTFFKNFFAHLKYKASFLLHTHVFSELNEKSLALAKSILQNNKPFLGFIPRVLIVFTDIIDKKEELHLDLVEEAQGIGAILFRKDLESVHFKISWSCRKVNFYLISEDESEKIRHAESIMENYDNEDVSLWIFSDDVRTEVMVAKTEVNNISVTRVNDIQSLIYHNLDINGINLFERCRETRGEKVISAVIVGLGRYGQEMLKALTWYCQLGDYKLKINVFDADEKTKEKFTQMCPELLDGKYNKNPKPIDGEPYYEIDIHNGVDVSVPEFEDELKKITDATYIFVCLGEDETNLSVASKIRSMCERIDYEGDGRKPVVETVIYDSNICKKLGITWDGVEKADQKNQAEPNRNKKRYEYDILMTGDLESFYSEETVLNSDLVKAGFKVHTFWSVEPARISFAEEYMEAEWSEFVKAEGLEVSWKEHYSAWQKENEKRKKAKEELLEFSYAINKFPFMKPEEIKSEEEFKNTNKEDKLKELKDTIAQRTHKWEKQVYSKFNSLINTPEYAAEWKQIESSKIAEAKKGFRFEYDYRSSIAKAIHKRLRKKIGFKPEITNKPWEDMTWDDKVAIGRIEHVRWNAYMRTEGYRYAPKRNDLARVHHNLVPVADLSNDDLRKDA